MALIDHMTPAERREFEAAERSRKYLRARLREATQKSKRLRDLARKREGKTN